MILLLLYHFQHNFSYSDSFWLIVLFTRGSLIIMKMTHVLKRNPTIPIILSTMAAPR